jgi:putative peptidoglycan lipid II flippase
VLFKPFGAPGLAAATAAGAWVNLLVLCFLAIRRGAMAIDLFFSKTVTAVTAASCILAVFALFAATPAQRLAAGLGYFADMFALILLGATGALLYGFALLAGLRIANVRLGRSSC